MNRFRFVPIFIILLLITACTPTEARPTSIPTIVTNTPEATAVPTQTAQPPNTPPPTQHRCQRQRPFPPDTSDPLQRLRPPCPTIPCFPAKTA